MRKNSRFILAALIAAVLLLTGCPTTKDITPAVIQDASEAQELIVGTWTEINRDGNVETHVWGADGSFYAEAYTKTGELVEMDAGTYCFEDGKIKLTITELGGKWTDGKLEPAGFSLTLYYTYYVTENSLHLERVKSITDGQTEIYRPTLKDDYTRVGDIPGKAAQGEPSKPAQEPAEAQPLIIGTWTEVNRDGNVETTSWKEDFSFQAVQTTPDGDIVEVDSGYYNFENGQLKVSITNAGGNWNGGVLEPIEPAIELYYNYYVTKNTLHLERTRKLFYGNDEIFNPPLTDDYTRK